MTQRMTCDVLVIGGGGAALKAAITAKCQDVDVLIVSKGTVGQSGATYYSVAEVGAFNVPDASLDPTDSPDVYYEDMKNASKGMARLRLSEILANNAIAALRELEALPGGDSIFTREADGRYKVYQACFSTKARSHVVQNHFKPILAVLKAEVERLGIRRISDITVTDLLVDQGECCGAHALDARGVPVVILAKSVILATGGSSQLFRKNMYPADITGDGYAMAHRAGARLTNMEFLQAGIGLASPSINLFQNYLWGGMPRITNRNGEDILSRHLPQGLTADAVLQAKREHFPFSSGDDAKYVEVSIQGDINRGLGNEQGNVQLAFNPAVIADVMKTNRNFSSMWPLTYEWYRNLGVDLEREPVEIACFAHAVNGGILIDEHAESSIPGLFAAGETAAGPHGADRLGGNMSITCQVFGKNAGIHAAQRARRQSTWRSGDQALEKAGEFAGSFAAAKDGIPLGDTLRRIQKASNEALLILRDEAGLDRYLDELNQAERMLRTESAIQSAQERTYAVCLQNLIESGRLMANAARMRRESRGSHFRTDYPEMDDRYAKNIILEYGTISFEA